jgi:hypothetical protein
MAWLTISMTAAAAVRTFTSSGIASRFPIAASAAA